MTVTITHTKVSTIPDGTDTTIVRPSDWNATHTLVGLGTAAELDAGVANGVATLDGSGKIPVSELPAAVLGALNYQGTWNASTNTPTLASGVGTKGYYYVVSVAGSTNLDGITDWVVGDWAVYNGTAWQKVDNTDQVTSVNGQTGAVVLTTTNVAEGTNEYFTTAKARASVSAGTAITYDNGTGVITNSAPDQTVSLTGAGTTVITGAYPSFTITSNDSTTGTVTSVAASAGTGISVTGSPITTSGTINITNTAPDQTVVLTAGTGISTSGTYPNFTITNTAPSSGGTVTSVTGTAPVVSSGGNTPAISMAAANTTTDGYLTSTDWNTFNNKTSNTGTVTSVSATVPSFLSITGSPITSSGTLAISYSGTALPIANGGTGLTALGTGVQTAIGVNVGTAGAFVVNGGALGTPSSGTVTNLTGTASININGTVGATTPGTGAFTTLTSSDNFTPTSYTETIVASGTVGASATLAITAGTVLTATLTSATACTFTMPTATAGKSFTLLLKQPASGTATTATFTGVKWNSGGAPTITATLGRLDIFAFVADGTNWYGTASQGYTY